LHVIGLNVKNVNVVCIKISDHSKSNGNCIENNYLFNSYIRKIEKDKYKYILVSQAAKESKKGQNSLVTSWDQR
jgi:hypothetical protein